LLVASFVLGGKCWNASVKMLTTISQTDRETLFISFTEHISVIYNADIVDWILTNWKVIADNHLQLIKQIKQFSPLEIIPVLDLSLGVVCDEILRFVEVAKRFVTCPAA
jgi:hypothetical protein